MRMDRQNQKKAIKSVSSCALNSVLAKLLMLYTPVHALCPRSLKRYNQYLQLSKSHTAIPSTSLPYLTTLTLPLGAAVGKCPTVVCLSTAGLCACKLGHNTLRISLHAPK